MPTRTASTLSKAPRSPVGGPVAPRFTPESKLELGQVLPALVEDGLLSAEQAGHVRSSIRPGQVDLHPLVMIANQKLPYLLQPGKNLTLEQLTEWLAKQAKLPYMKLDPMKIDMGKVTDIIGQVYAQRYRILPIEVNEYEVLFATCEPFFEAWIPDLRHLLRREIRRVVCNPLDVHRFQMDFYGVTRSVRKAKDAQEAGRENQAKLLNFEQLLELGKAGNIGADDHHVVHIVDWLLQFAFEQRASDIHLEPRRDISPVRFRIDGMMHKVFELPTPVLVAVTSRIKILGRMDLAEKRRPQDGRIKTLSPNGREVEMRLSTMPTAFGEKVVMRIFDPDIVVKDFKTLGFGTREAQTWSDLIHRPHGIVLVTGPTGSGKTTTLYSTLKLLARPELNVCTVEDPIEMVTPDFNQMQVQQQLDLGFAEGVRTLLRQDPDIIMIGEIRDLQTAQMAIQASLTGHLVLSTLHTNDSPSAISRLLDLGAPHYLIQSTLAGVMAQRLVRTLCAHCKTPDAPIDEGEWQLLTRPWVAEAPQHACAPNGCLECRKTGFLGRTGIYEMFKISPEIRKLIKAETSLPELTETAVREGMRPLRISAAAQVARGVTTLDEVWKVLPPPEV